MLQRRYCTVPSIYQIDSRHLGRTDQHIEKYDRTCCKQCIGNIRTLFSKQQYCTNRRNAGTSSSSHENQNRWKHFTINTNTRQKSRNQQIFQQSCIIEKECQKTGKRKGQTYPETFRPETFRNDWKMEASTSFFVRQALTKDPWNVTRARAYLGHTFSLNWKHHPSYRARNNGWLIC